MTKNIIEDSDGELAMSVFINKNGHNKSGHFGIQMVHIADDALVDCNRA